jgi:hypothetical protein
MIRTIFNAISGRVKKKCLIIEDVISKEAFIKNKLDPLVDIIKQNLTVMNDYFAVLEEQNNQ